MNENGAWHAPNKDESSLLTLAFPISRVRRLVKSESEVQWVGVEAGYLIAKATVSTSLITPPVGSSAANLSGIVVLVSFVSVRFGHDLRRSFCFGGLQESFLEKVVEGAFERMQANRQGSILYPHLCT